MASASALIGRANAGDEAAWNAIVERFSGLVWATTRAHRLSSAEAADVAQTTWLRLVENLDRIHDPDRLGAWLATTARRECLRVIRRSGQELVTGDDWVLDAATDDPVDGPLLVRERDDALRRALARIGERCQALLRLLAAVDPPSYEEIGAALGMPIGAIGPTRARCLEKLRRSPELAGHAGG
ncbi:MAG TPA: sigma-70 family RNA polymerase sigma factor [Solirubrobacteraceae bacterium]|jgi:RNA polymerase sigma factor (sigma-70 family)|nr:sigma-70 family RNA polymerase sigma factor [Solirubrobacteraceae bacterium]